MKYLHKICLAAVMAAVLALLCGCNAADYALPAQVDMQPGESVALAGLVHYTGTEEEQATAEDAAALLETIGSVDNISFNFASSVPGVVSVDEEGVMTAGLTGDATVIVSCAALDYYAEVRVSVRNLPQSLTVEPVAAMTPGENYTLNADVRPGKKYAQLLYTTADESIATVDENGVITAVATGETAVSAQVAGSSLTSVCRVVVTQEDEMMQGVNLSRGDAAMTAGETLLLSAGTYPESDAAVVWQSTDENVVTVDETGMMTAVSAGAAAVTATVGEKTATCAVTVTAPATAETATPEAVATPETATNETATTPETATPETATPETAATPVEEEVGELIVAETWGATEETATAESATEEPTTDEDKATAETATGESAAKTETIATPETATEETTDKASAETTATAESAAAGPSAVTPETATVDESIATSENATEDEMEEIALDVFYDEQTPESATAGSAAHDEEDAEPQSNPKWPHLPNGVPMGPGPVIPQQTPETATPKEVATPETATSEEITTPETATPEDAATPESATPETATAESALEEVANEAARSVEQWVGDLIDRLLD